MPTYPARCSGPSQVHRPELLQAGTARALFFSLPVRLAPRPGYLQVFPEASVQSNNESPVVAAAAVSPLTPSASNFGMSDTSGNHVLNPQTPGDFENQYTFL